MTQVNEPSTWLAGVDWLVRRFERPLKGGWWCRRTQATAGVAVAVGVAVSSQLFIVLVDRLGRVPGMALGIAYGLLAGFMMWTGVAWAERCAPRWQAQASDPGPMMPGFRGLSLVLLFGGILAVLPLVFLLPRNGALGSFWGSMLVVYAILLNANQKAGLGAWRRLQEAREQSLRARVAPHFLFNTLNSIKAQISRDPQAAEATLDRLASLYRQLLETAESATVPLREELAFVEAYLGIEKARMGARLTVDLDVPEDLEDCPVPPLSLQVLVENAVKHGIAPLEQGGRVRIQARREDGALVLAVTDPGDGLGGEPGTGTALETLRRRLARPGDLVLERRGGEHIASFRWRP